MAGPFSVAPSSAQEIAPQQVAGGADTSLVAATKPASGLDIAANALASGIQFGKLAKDQLDKAAVEGVQTQVRSVRDALALSQNPEKQETFFGKEAAQDPYMQSVQKELMAIKEAQRQGRLPSDYALERMDEVTATAISKRPQFVNEIRSAANAAAGINIAGQVYQELSKLSPQQRAQQDLEQKAATLGIDATTYQAAARQQFAVQQELQTLQLKKARGTYQANDVAGQVRLGVVSTNNMLQEEILRQTNSGGVTDPEVLEAVVRQSFTGLRNSILADMPSSVSGSELNSHMSTLDAEEERLVKMVQNGSAVKLLQTQRNLFTEMAHEEVRSAGDPMKLFYLMGGGESGMKALDMYSKYKTNPQAMAGMFSAGEGGGALTLGLFFDDMQRAAQIVNGQREGATSQEKLLSGYLAGLKLKFNNAPTQGENEAEPIKPQDAQRLVDVVAGMGEDYSTVTLSDPKVAETVAQYKETHGALINHYKNDLASLQRQYRDLKARGLVTDEEFQLVGTFGRPSQITSQRFESRILRAEDRPFGGPTPADNKDVSDFLRRSNQVLTLGHVYKGKGVLPDTIFQNGLAFLGEIQNPSDQRTAGGQQDAPQVVRFVRDANGNLVREQ